MDRVHRNRLEVHRQSIVDDLEVIVISDTLVEKGVISEAQNTSILLEKTEHDQARKLLDILPNQGPDAFGIFVEVLRSDYDWLAEKLESADSDHLKASEDELVQLEILDRLLLKGGVPHQLSHRITREEKLGVLKEKLESLKPGNFLVLHGTPGSGKSVLAAEALRDPAISLKYFPDGVFWFRVGMLEEHKLLERIQIFCEKLDAPTKPTSIEHGQEILRK
ncbi:apoptotic protease-activating factor 1-like [Tigriopus californicus]|uniref:apoptotic protease-activating factor 1-like n=1 Tax=Tigriopus californicus TaxID=6832 RepID=UPI0027DA90B5|nr:apoptotic protease-activating factor 1-like [Tigriopus californicus]